MWGMFGEVERTPPVRRPARREARLFCWETAIWGMGGSEGGSVVYLRVGQRERGPRRVESRMEGGWARRKGEETKGDSGWSWTDVG